MENYFNNRASVRTFNDKEISQSELREIIEEAMHAPTCGNMQLYSVIITKDKDKLKELIPFHFSQPAAQSANVILTICADFNRFTQWCEAKNASPGYDNFHSFLNAFTDAVIFAQQIVTIAEMKGLGTCYLGTVIYNPKQISELLRLPDLVIPVACIAMGNYDNKPAISSRLPLEAVIHEEEYVQKSDEEIINLFKIKEEEDGAQQFIKENNKENIAQVYTDVRYPGEQNFAMSEIYLNLLKEKKFL